MRENLYKIKLMIRAIAIMRIFKKINKLESRLLKQNVKISEISSINKITNIEIRSNILRSCEHLLDSSDICLEIIDMIDEEIMRER